MDGERRMVHESGAEITGPLRVAVGPWGGLAACVRDAEAHASCVPAGPRYTECDDPERLAAHRAEHGPGSVQVMVPSIDLWRRAQHLRSEGFRDGMERGHRYRLVHRAPSTPEPPFPGAIPTGRGTWIASEGAGKVPTEGWEATDGSNRWRHPGFFVGWLIVEARPIPEPERTVTATLTEATAEHFAGRAKFARTGIEFTAHDELVDAARVALAAEDPS